MKPGQWNAEFRNGARVRTTAPRNDGPVPPCTYNFVPLSACVHRPAWGALVSQDWPFGDGWCGEIEYTLTAETPLLVARGGEPKNVKRFARECDAQGRERAVIPGSSVRGMLRNVLEIASFGKFQRVGNRALSLRDITRGGLARGMYGERLTQIVPPMAFRARSRGGWLKFENGCWRLTPCEIARVEHHLLAHVLDVDDFRGFATDKSGRVILDQEGKPKKKALTANEAYRKWIPQGEGSERLALRFTIEGKVEDIHKRLSGKQLVYTKAGAIMPPKNVGTGLPGTLVFTGSVGSKHMEFIFFNERPPVTVADHVMVSFFQVHAECGEQTTQEGSSRPETTLEKVREVFKDHPRGFPVFYLSENDSPQAEPVAIGLSQMFRLAYEQSIHEAVAAVNPAHLEGESDLAELVFGRVVARSKNGKTRESAGERSLRGRVAFDALREEAVDGKYGTELESKGVILGAPKPSFHPYYMEQPAASNGSVIGTAVDCEGNDVYEPGSSATRCVYMGLSSQSAASRKEGPPDRRIPASNPRGWKRYPVRPMEAGQKSCDPLPEWARRQFADIDNDNVKVTLRPLGKGARFRGRIRFHNLRETELAALVWAMSWGGREDHWHALGLGKSFGWGGCRIAIERVTARRNDAGDAPLADVTERWRGSAGSVTFVAHMEAAYGEWAEGAAEGRRYKRVGWAESEQVQELLAMADPARSTRAPQELRHPWAGGRGGIKAFSALKQDGIVLPRYGGHFAPAGSREAEARRARLAPR